MNLNMTHAIRKFLLLFAAITMALTVNALGIVSANGNNAIIKGDKDRLVSLRSMLKKHVSGSVSDKSHAEKTAVIKYAGNTFETPTYMLMHYTKYGDWMNVFSTDDMENQFYFDVVCDTIANGTTYSSQNGDFDLNYTIAFIGADDYDGMQANTADFTWTRKDNGEEDVVAHMTFDNGETYTVTYHKPATPPVVGNKTYTFEDAELTDFMEQYQAILFSAENDYVTVQLAFNADDFTGTYNYHQFNDALITTLEGDEISFVDGNATVTYENGAYVCRFVGIGSDQIKYDITMKAEEAMPAPLKYDCTTEDFYYSFGEKDEVDINNSYFEQYGITWADAVSADGSVYTSLMFNYAKEDPITIIPLGTYIIDGSYENGTVVASEGVDDTGHLDGSYVTTVNEDGYLVQPIWFIVDGTVTVDSINGKVIITVDGVNSAGRIVNFTIEAPQRQLPKPGASSIVNGGFEEWTSDTLPVGWGGWQTSETSNTGGAKLQKTTDSHSGSYACLIKGESSNKRLATEKMTLASGDYTVEFYAKSDNGCEIKPGMASFMSGGKLLYSYGEFATAPIHLTSDWQRYTYRFTLNNTQDVSMLIMVPKNTGDCIIDDYNVCPTATYEGISNVIVTPLRSSRSFNIAGQQVTDGFKGITIVNGKKYIAK